MRRTLTVAGLLIACSPGDEGAPAPSAAASAPSAPALEAAAPSPATSAADRPRPSFSLQRAEPAEPERALAHHLMSCVAAGGPTVCPWHASAFDPGRAAALERRCAASDARACLLDGLAREGRGEHARAAASIARACEAREPLACVYLALAVLACREPTFGPACDERYKSALTPAQAEATLTTECQNDVGAACLGLAVLVYPHEDNRFPLLERGCRLGVMGACAAFADELADKEVRGRGDRARAVHEIMGQICDERPEDCAEGAFELAGRDPDRVDLFRLRSCDFGKPLHLPAERCR